MELAQLSTRSCMSAAGRVPRYVVHVWRMNDMNDLLLFVTGALPGPALSAKYDPKLVALSYVVASLAAYTAIDFAGRVSEFRTEPRRAAAWLTGRACALGPGLWTVHFLAIPRCQPAI